MSIYQIKSLILGLCVLTPTLSLAAVKEYQLVIEEKSINLTGKSVPRIHVNGQFPAPLLEFEEGDDAVIHVKNKLKNQDSSVHWHGLLLPGLMDGVPGFNGFQGIAPNEEFTYRFKVRQSGTYWYHAHSKGQEQDGLYGSLVIYPKAKPVAHEQVQQDYVVMLSDFHEHSSAQIFRNLKRDAEFYQNQRETVPDLWQQIKTEGFSKTWHMRKMWNQMRMLRTDLSDVTGYTFLVNGQTPVQHWTGLFQAQDKVRLRFINASAMSFFDVRIPQLKMTVVSADGQAVQPVAVDEFRIGAAETYDVIVEPQAAYYRIEAESIDRAGFALAALQQVGTTAPQHLKAPKPRPRALLTMQDMGHAEMDHSKMNHEHSAEVDHSKMNHAPSAEIDHSKMNHAPSAEVDHSKMNHAQSAEVDHSKMNHAQSAEIDHSKMNHAPSAEIDHSKMNHAQSAEMDHSKMHHAVHAHTEQQSSSSEHQVFGWRNAATPKGHKALQYEDLKSLSPQADVRPAERELIIRLGGTMERYLWTMNGKKFADAEPLQVQYGERIRLKFINDSMMAHPMHLHGMFVQLENGQSSADLPNKHTVVVAPGQTVTALLTADELGEWAIHCHLLYHMSAGMMNKLVVAAVGAEATEQGAAHAH